MGVWLQFLQYSRVCILTKIKFNLYADTTFKLLIFVFLNKMMKRSSNSKQKKYVNRGSLSVDAVFLVVEIMNISVLLNRVCVWHDSVVMG